MRNPCKFSRSISKVELEKEVMIPVSFTSLDKLIDTGAFDKSTFISDLFTLPKPRVERKNSSPRVPSKPSRPQLAPSVFFTPELDSPPTRSPSPFAIKFKKRGQFLVDSSPVPDHSWRKKEAVKSGESEAVKVNEDDSPKKVLMADLGKSVEDDSCFDPQESASCVTTDVDEDSIGSTSKVFSTQLSAAEFYDGDAPLFVKQNRVLHFVSSDISGEISPRMYTLRDYDVELAELRASMASEAEARKKAEEALSAMVSYWKTMREHLFSAGISMPEYHVSGPSPAKEICEQFDVARYVFKAIGRGIGKAEVEMEMERKLKEKDMEIGKLIEYVKDYDEIKRELCRRKEEAVELTRRYKAVKKKNQWLWGSVAAGMSLGTASLACYYLGNGDVSSSVTDDAS